MWRVVQAGACILLVALFQLLWRTFRSETTSSATIQKPGSPISIATAAWSASAALAIVLLVHFSADLAHLIRLLVDPAKNR